MVLCLTGKKSLMNHFNVLSDDDSTINGLLSELISTHYENDRNNNVNSSQLLNVVNSWNNKKSTCVKTVNGTSKKIKHAIQDSFKQIISYDEIFFPHV